MKYGALALVGPTASGKTALSLGVARALGAEIISMDSRSVFRGMDVGTAKPTPEERQGIPHHGIDLVDPDVRFNAGEFGRYARERIEEIRARGRVPMLVGGTGFFLRALTHPIFREPELDPNERSRLLAELEELEDAALLQKLRDVDPEAAERFATWGGRQRILRALEVPLLTGHTLAWWHQAAPPEAEPVSILPFVLDVPRERLKAAIDRRTDEMVAAGLVEEVQALVHRFGEDAPGLNAHGYAEMIPYLKGERTLEEALELVRRNTKAYTKRQVTWFRHQLPEGAVWLDGTRPQEELAREIVQKWQEAEGEQKPA
ncbi:MAG: tRNA (adenosine(37)-N6)-dimethylallyltransferase MiaA [Gemmatimonadetes bacterium]|nr:tRNA (adenosine(37)-N6)-dimethylallyltransferase MiaA [Gemmatimonadota bacterium]